MTTDRTLADDDPLAAFTTAADRLISRGAGPYDLTEAQILGERVAAQLGIFFAGADPSDPGREALDWLRRVDALTSKDAGVRRKRWRCVDALDYWGREWRKPEWQASEQTRGLLLRQLAKRLAYEDPAFDALTGDLLSLAAKLDRYGGQGGQTC